MKEKPTENWILMKWLKYFLYASSAKAAVTAHHRNSSSLPDISCLVRLGTLIEDCDRKKTVFFLKRLLQGQKPGKWCNAELHNGVIVRRD